MSGLFSTFNVAKRGIFVQQKAIDVTSHNIANANTEGYSRQRALMDTTRPFAMPSINNSIGPGQLGTGVEISKIQRVRDEFLDFQFRNEQGIMGKYEARDKFLSEIESVFNEPSDKSLSTALGKFFDSWQELSKQAETSNARTIVAQQSNALSNELNHIYNQFQKIRMNTQTIIKDTVFQINNYLDQINSLNQQIQNVKVSGQEPNDLMDKRDLLLDKLSYEFNINIKKRNFSTIDLSTEDGESVPEVGEKLLVRKESNYKVSRFSYINGVEENITTINSNTHTNLNKYTGNLEINYLKQGDSNKSGNRITIEFKDLTKSQLKELKRHIEECRVIWANEQGDAYSNAIIRFDSIKDGTGIDLKKLDKQLGLFTPCKGRLKGYMSVQEDVDRNEDKINKLAKAIAFAVNTIHSGKINELDDKMKFFINSKDINMENEINAGNIAVNSEIMENVMQIKTRVHDNEFDKAIDNIKDGENDGKRALAIAQLRNTLFKIQDIKLEETDRAKFIEQCTGKFTTNKDLGIDIIQSNINGMTIDNYFKDSVDILGIQENEARRILENQEKLLADFDQRRTSISGVSMDEEMANLIAFQHAYGANAKIISTVDELLDVVVNGLKR